MATKAHEYTYGATKNEPDSATGELRIRPRLQLTTIRPEYFIRFKNCRSVVVEVPESPRFFKNHYSTTTIDTDDYNATMNHADA